MMTTGRMRCDTCGEDPQKMTRSKDGLLCVRCFIQLQRERKVVLPFGGYDQIVEALASDQRNIGQLEIIYQSPRP